MKITPVHKTVLNGTHHRFETVLNMKPHTEQEDNDKFFKTLFDHFTKEEMDDIFKMASEIRGTS